VTGRFGCCSGCLVLFALLLLTSAWIGSTWAERALELLSAVALVAIYAAVNLRRGGGRLKERT